MHTEAKIKNLEDVNLEKETAFLATFIGDRRIKSINKEDFTVWDGERTWICNPKTKIEVLEIKL